MILLNLIKSILKHLGLIKPFENDSYSIKLKSFPTILSFWSNHFWTMHLRSNYLQTTCILCNSSQLTSDSFLIEVFDEWFPHVWSIQFTSERIITNQTVHERFIFDKIVRKQPSQFHQFGREWFISDQIKFRQIVPSTKVSTSMNNSFEEIIHEWFIHLMKSFEHDSSLTDFSCQMTHLSNKIVHRMNHKLIHLKMNLKNQTSKNYLSLNVSSTGIFRIHVNDSSRKHFRCGISIAKHWISTLDLWRGRGGNRGAIIIGN